MNRSLVILLGALVLCATLLGGSYAVSRHVCQRCMSKSVSDLDWLQQEFHLSDAELARIQKLHEGYLPKCAEMCAKIAAKKSELETALGGVLLHQLFRFRTQGRIQTLPLRIDGENLPQHGERFVVFSIAMRNLGLFR